jgi:pyrroloquinoline quinone (PQQ) biosynthesis protein C
MSFYERLIAETSREREAFLTLPLVQRTIQKGASRALYIDFLTTAYHHVKHTFPLLALAASRTSDARYQDALVEYMKEERGHEKWVLDDIRAVGGNEEAVRYGAPRAACQIMVGYAYYAIEHISPYTFLGSVHVLEGMSMLLADRVANALATSLGVSGDKGFSYLRTHGSIDVEHAAFFRRLVDSFGDAATQQIVIDNARIFYRLYGAIFRDLDEQQELRNAA